MRILLLIGQRELVSRRNGSGRGHGRRIGVHVAGIPGCVLRLVLVGGRRGGGVLRVGHASFVVPGSVGDLRAGSDHRFPVDVNLSQKT